MYQPISTANPWPQYDWPALRRAFEANMRAFAWAWQPMRRRFPASDYFHACEVQTRFLSHYPYCRLAQIPYEAVLETSPIYQRAPKLPIHTPDPRGRILRFVHRQLDKLIAWRQGWRKADRLFVSTGKNHPIF